MKLKLGMSSMLFISTHKVQVHIPMLCIFCFYSEMESEISADSPETKTESDAGIQVMNSRIQIPL